MCCTLSMQVQRLKVDTEAAMLELDQILKANELSISLVAAVPALALTWAVLSTTVRWAGGCPGAYTITA